MIDQTDFSKKQIIFYFPFQGDKMRFKNDNLVIERDGKIISQVTCYRLFLIFVVGDATFTTVLLKKAKQFGFSICFMNRNMKVQTIFTSRMEGNTVLRKLQYNYTGLEIGQHIICNKIINQKTALNQFRRKTEQVKETIVLLDEYINKLQREEMSLNSIMGIEGSAARIYFPAMFNNINWKRRVPRIKSDYVNASLDMGYTILFNIIDGLVNVFGFDEYYGVLHQQFYMRKSLICDLMEPMRPVVDYTIRKGINLKQITEDDFQNFNKRYILDWKTSTSYCQLFLEEILKYKTDLFLYIQGYYRAFMKQKPVSEFPMLLYRG